jgi:hypothetical protein
VVTEALAAAPERAQHAPEAFVAGDPVTIGFVVGSVGARVGFVVRFVVGFMAGLL